MNNLTFAQSRLIHNGFTKDDLIEIVNLYNVNEYHVYIIYLRNTHQNVQIHPYNRLTPHDEIIQIDGLIISIHEINDLINFLT